MSCNTKIWTLRERKDKSYRYTVESYEVANEYAENEFDTEGNYRTREEAIKYRDRINSALENILS